MTINADSIEYVDLCAILKGDPAAIVKDMASKLNTIYTTMKNPSTNTTTYFDEATEARNRIKYYDSKDKLPVIVAPVETRWLVPPHRNRILKPGLAQIKITAKNAKPYVADIIILDKPQDDKIIQFINATNTQQTS